MKNMISIIVPIYNVEQYLDCCVQSILAQTYQEIEVILVDDGSSDKSCDICKRWAEKDDRIRYFYQENQGVSVARNRGMKEAHGDYIVFMDADDYICDSYCEELLENLVRECLDIIYCEETSILLDGKTISHGDSRRVYTWESSKYEYNRHMAHITVWGALYRKEIIKGIQFSEDLYVGEDSVFFAMAVRRARKIGYYDASLYNYRILEMSSCRGMFDKKKYTEIEAWRRICKVFEDWPLTKLSAEAKFAETCNFMISRYSLDAEFDETVVNEVIRECRKNLPSLIKYNLMKGRIPVKHMVKGLFPHLYILYLKEKSKWMKVGK